MTGGGIGGTIGGIVGGKGSTGGIIVWFLGVKSWGAPVSGTYFLYF